MSSTMSSTDQQQSGGGQYAHQDDSTIRQDVLNRLFEDTSRELFVNKSGAFERANQQEEFRVLEIGCGAGHTTMSLSDWLPQNTRITAVDTAQNLIESAQQNLHPGQKDRIEFICANGETLHETLSKTFDVVWMRFVIVHVPDPVKMLESAKACLKPGGLLLVEDVDASGWVSDPPFLANDFLHRAHIKLSKEHLGADQERGRMIGRFLTEIGMSDIHVDSFVPLFGRGVQVSSWGSTTRQQEDTSKQRFQLALDLLRMSGQTLSPHFLQHGLMKDENELQDVLDSIDKVSKSSDYQLMSLPGGKIFQWWATK